MKNPDNWYTSKEISEQLAVSIGSVTMSLKKLRKTNIIKYRNTGKRNTFQYMVQSEPAKLQERKSLVLEPMPSQTVEQKVRVKIKPKIVHQHTYLSGQTFYGVIRPKEEVDAIERTRIENQASLATKLAAKPKSTRATAKPKRVTRTASLATPTRKSLMTRSGARTASTSSKAVTAKAKTRTARASTAKKSAKKSTKTKKSTKKTAKKMTKTRTTTKAKPKRAVRGAKKTVAKKAVKRVTKTARKSTRASKR
jgi:hypothetical protein